MAGRYGVQIRAAASADAGGIATLMEAAGRSVCAAALASRLDAVRREPGAVLLAIEWGPPSGVIVLNWFSTLETDHPVAQITTLLVAPDDRRRGIGRLLLKAGAQAARLAGCGTLRLAGAAGDPALGAFADAAGFASAEPGYVRSLRKRPARGASSPGAEDA